MIYTPDPAMAAELDRQAVDVPPGGFHLPDDEIESFLATMSPSPYHVAESPDSMRQRAIYYVLWKHYGLPQDRNSQVGRKFLTDQRVIMLHDTTRRIHRHELPEIRKSITGVAEQVLKSSTESASAIVDGIKKASDRQADIASTTAAASATALTSLTSAVESEVRNAVAVINHCSEKISASEAAAREQSESRQTELADRRLAALQKSVSGAGSAIVSSISGASERSTNRVVAAVNTSAESASRSVNASVDRLSGTVTDGATAVSSSLNATSTAIREGFAQLYYLLVEQESSRTSARESARAEQEKKKMEMTETLFRWGRTASRVLLAWMILILILLGMLVMSSSRAHAQAGIDCIYFKNADGTTARNYCAPFTFAAGTGVTWTALTGNLTINTSGGGGGTPVAGNNLLAGGGIVWVSGYTYLVSSATYTIQGTQFTSPQTSVTLAAADPTNDRIDIITATSSSTVVVITGTPSANPAIPAYDPSTELPLGFIFVNHNTTQPTNTTNLNIYLNNAEWTCTGSASVNCNDTTNPFEGTKDIKVTSASTNDFVNLANGSPINPATYNDIVFYIQNISVNNKRNLTLQWRLGGVVVGSPVVVSNGLYGYSNTNTSAYQQIVVPVPNFALNGSTADTVRITVGGSGGTPSFYLDKIFLQAGGSTQPSGTGMTWRGTWSSSTAYNVNDVVLYNFVSYVCLVSNTNIVPYGNATQWQQLGGFPVHQFSFGVPGLLTAGQEVGLGATDFALTFPANFSGSTGFIGPNGANPTATNTITIEKNSGGVVTTIGTVVTATNGAYTFTTTGGTAQSLAAGDGLIAINQNPADATFASPAFTLVGYLGPLGPNVSFTGQGALQSIGSSVNNNVVKWSGTTGGVVADSGVAFSTDGTFAANSDALAPTQKATGVQIQKYGSGGPTTVTGLTRWFAADQISGLTDGTAITQWPDFSTQGTAAWYLDATTGGSGHNPVYKTNILNGKPIIRFDGTGWLDLQAPFVAGEPQWSVFLVLKITSLTNAYTGILGSNLSSDQGGYFIKSNGKTALYMPTSVYDGTGSFTFTTAAFHIISIIISPNSVSTRVDLAADSAAGIAFTPTSAFTPDMMIGSQKTTPRVFTGDIAEIMWYRRGLNSTDVSTVENYLKSKYGL